MRWVVIPQLTYIPIIINRQKLGMGTYMTEHIGFFTLSPYFLSLVAPIFLDFRFYIPLTYQQSLFPTYFFLRMEKARTKTDTICHHTTFYLFYSSPAFPSTSSLPTFIFIYVYCRQHTQSCIGCFLFVSSTQPLSQAPYTT